MRLPLASASARYSGLHCLPRICWPWFCGSLTAQIAPPPFPTGKVIPKVVCSADSKQSYALYLPSTFSATRKWPIVYLFDPLARGEVAVEAARAAAEKFGYILVASNNSRNGPMADSTAAANAVWKDTQERFPVEERRRYLAGMSGWSAPGHGYRALLRWLRRRRDRKRCRISDRQNPRSAT